MKIVTLPYLTGKYRKSDDSFGDERLYDVTPGNFVALIKKATCVFTDSFHATAFSLIYNKEFFVFERSSKISMASRISNLLDLLELESRFCDTEERECVDYIEGLTKIDYGRRFDKFVEEKSQSIQFLMDNLLGKGSEYK